MAETKIVKSWGSSCARQVILAIVVFLVILAGFIGLIILSFALSLTEDQRVYLWVSGFTLLLLLAFAGIIIWTNRLIRKRATQLNGIFSPLGVSGKGYLWNGRQYHGIYRGRQADIYFSRGPTLDIYIASPIHTRLGIGLKGRSSRIAYSIYTQLKTDTNGSELENLSIYSLDSAWGQELVNNSQAKDIIVHLLAGRTSLEFRSLLFQPEALHLQINRIDIDTITTDSMRSMFDELVNLSAIAESLPGPQITASASAMERRARLNRSGFTVPMVAITCAMVSFFAAIFVISLLVIINLSGGKL